MILQRRGQSLQSPLRTLSFLVLHLLLTQSCTGQSQMIGSSQPIVAAVGDDVVLPCYLKPLVDVAAMTLEWTRSDLKPIFVHVWRAGQDLIHSKNPSYKDRTSLFVDEMKRGNISLKLSDVKPSDEGTYKCYIPKLDKGSSVQLVVGAVASTMIDLAGMDRNKGGVMLNCKSEGWFPQPEVLWLDGEGKLLSAGPPETVRGPDGLYTVSSRVTVEKRHSNRFTCRVQQKNINQTREAHIQVSDDFFVQSSSSSSVTGLAVGLAVCILIILLLVFFVWRQNKNKTRRQNASKAEQKKLLEEKHEGQKEVVSLKTQLEIKNKEVQTLTAELKRLEEEKNKSEDNLKKQVETLTAVVQKLEKEKRESEENLQKQLLEDKHEVEKKVISLQTQLKAMTKELKDQQQEADRKWNQTNKELTEAKTQLGKKEREVQTLTAKLSEEKKEREGERQRLQKQVEGLDAEVKKITDEKRKSETEQQKLLEEKQEAQREVISLQTQLEAKNKEVGELTAQVRELNEDLETKKKEDHRLAGTSPSSLGTKARVQPEMDTSQSQSHTEDIQEDVHPFTVTPTDNVTRMSFDGGRDGRKTTHTDTTGDQTQNPPAVGGQIMAAATEDEQMESVDDVQKQRVGSSSAESPLVQTADHLVIEVDREGRFIRLRNTSSQDQPLRGWKLKLKINNEELDPFTFDSPVLFWAGMAVTLWRSGYRTHRPASSDLVWENLKKWRPEDHLEFVLFSNTGEIKSEFIFTGQ